MNKQKPQKQYNTGIQQQLFKARDNQQQPIKGLNFGDSLLQADMILKDLITHWKHSDKAIRQLTLEFEAKRIYIKYNKENEYPLQRLLSYICDRIYEIVDIDTFNNLFFTYNICNILLYFNKTLHK